MFQPVGPHRPSVYWRRRLVLLALVVLVFVLLVTVIRSMASPSSAAPAAAATSHTPAPPRHAAASGSTRTAARPAPPATAKTSAAHHVATSARSAASAAGTVAPTTTATTTAPPQPCAASQLRVAALSAQERYGAGTSPVLGMQIVNAGTKPCVQDLGDGQVLLQVYNGQARVWGSHDCGVQPGSNPQTLAPGRPVRVEITWSGLSSQPHCAGTRQRVGAGSYTLYVALSGRTGTAATFAIG